MTKQDCLDYIKIAVPAADAAKADIIAGKALAKAVSKFGRMKNVGWNSVSQNITLTSGTSKYDAGVDLLTDPNGWTIYFMWANDTPGWPIHIVSVEDFNEYARGSSTTGRPTYATLHSDERILEFWPIPDSAYSVWTYYRKQVSTIEDVPQIYYDALCDYAVLCVKGLYDTAIARELAAENMKDVKEDSLVMWDGNVITLVNNVTTYPKTGGVLRSDSQNLRGDL